MEALEDEEGGLADVGVVAVGALPLLPSPTSSTGFTSGVTLNRVFGAMESEVLDTLKRGCAGSGRACAMTVPRGVACVLGAAVILLADVVAMLVSTILAGMSFDTDDFSVMTDGRAVVVEVPEIESEVAAEEGARAVINGSLGAGGRALAAEGISTKLIALATADAPSRIEMGVIVVPAEVEEEILSTGF